MASYFNVSWISVFVVAGALTASGSAMPETATAQSANNVKCKGCVGAKDLGKKAVRAKHIKPGQVKGNHIADEAITEDKIAEDAVTEDKIADDSITGSMIQDGSISANHFSPNALPSMIASGADDDAGNLNATNLTATQTTFRSVTISAPSAGLIVAIASGNFSIDPLSGATCSISDDDNINLNYGIQGFTPTATGMSGSTNMPFGSTRVFEVTGAGDFTVNLVCYEPTGTSKIIDPSLTALFVPNRY